MKITKIIALTIPTLILGSMTISILIMQPLYTLQKVSPILRSASVSKDKEGEYYGITSCNIIHIPEDIAAILPKKDYYFRYKTFEDDFGNKRHVLELGDRVSN